MTEYIIRQPERVDSSLSIEPLIVGEIVRCRDCEFEDEPWKCVAPDYREPDGFCWLAKRKEVGA